MVLNQKWHLVFPTLFTALALSTRAINWSGKNVVRNLQYRLRKRQWRGVSEPRLSMITYSREPMEVWKVWKMTTIFSLGPTIGKPHTKRRQIGSSIFVSTWWKWPSSRRWMRRISLWKFNDNLQKKIQYKHRKNDARLWTITSDILFTNHANILHSHSLSRFSFVDHVAFSFLLFLRKLHKKMSFCFQRISSDFIKEASRNDEVSIRDN